MFQCKSEYRHLQPAAADNPCYQRIAPLHAQTAWYTAAIDVSNHHISGLLLIKTMPDSSWRIVFTNEAGITFMDLGFLKNGNFKVYHMISQLNRRAVVTTLRKDFELILGLPFEKGAYNRFIGGEEVYFGVKEKKETAYFITRKDCASLQRMERGSRRRRIVSVNVPAQGYPAPEQIVLTHHTFNMQIKLNRIQKE